MRWKCARKWAKWTCTVSAVLAVAMAVGSGFYSLDYGRSSGVSDTFWSIGVGSGQVSASRMDGWQSKLFSPSLGWKVERKRQWYWGYTGESTSYPNDWKWHAGVMYVRYPDAWVAFVSVLYPVALTLVPTALLWYADRRRFKPGSCSKCGYSRAGLATGAACPECGTVPSA